MPAGAFRERSKGKIMRNFVCLFGAMIGGLVTVFLAAVLVFGLRDAASVPDAPLQMDLSAAVSWTKSGKSSWVWLTDVDADCARFAWYTAAGKDGETEDAALFVAQNTARDLEVVVDARDVRECRYVARVNYIGMLKSMDDDKRRDVAAHGIAPAASAAWWLCTQCRPGGEWFAAIVLPVMICFAGWLTVTIYKARTGPGESRRARIKASAAARARRPR
jgi:hypothetical protein